MLKIRDSINLRELEKFGFVDEGCFLCYGDYSSLTFISILYADKIICISQEEGSHEIDDIIYELIKANLVEKVEDK